MVDGSCFCVDGDDNKIINISVHKIIKKENR